MSQYKSYPTLKDSGVEWMGAVPESWRVCRLAYACTLLVDGTHNSPESFAEGDYLYITAKNIKENGFDFSDVSYLKKTDHRDIYQRCPVEMNDVLYIKDGATAGIAMVNTLGQEFSLLSSVALIRPCRDFLDSRFVAYHLNAGGFKQQALSQLVGGAITRFTLEMIGGFVFVMPSIKEQLDIVAFLDRETARIDSLVEKKTRFIELLVEKRQAIITRTVAKGVDSSVKMMDPEVEWLGNMPAHWRLLPLKYVAGSLTVGIVVNPSDYVSEEGAPFIYGGDISEGKISFEGSRRISPEHSAQNAKTQLRVGDLLTVRVGAPGITAVVPRECEGGNCASVMLTRRGSFDSDWLCYVMNSRVVRYQVEVVQYGAAQEQFNIGHAVDFLIPTPPVDEQRAIAAYLKYETTRIDTLIHETTRSITLLKERRAALITAAVTGQIDLRKAA